MNDVNDPVKQTTPIWWLQAGVLKGVLGAVIILIGLAASAFGVDEALLSAKLAKAVDPLLILAEAGALWYIAHQRTAKPTPPVTLSRPTNEDTQ